MLHALYRLQIPKQELTVQVTEIDRVHINNMNVGKAGEGEVRENLAT